MDWLCWPRFDSPSLFAALLDRERGGAFRVAPAGRFRTERAYVEGTNVLLTTFRAPGGEVRLTDLMAVGGEDERGRGLFPAHELLRVATCVSGEVEVELAADLRPAYGAERSRERPALGNFPQAFTHVALVDAALSIGRRARRDPREAPETAGRAEARP